VRNGFRQLTESSHFSEDRLAVRVGAPCGLAFSQRAEILRFSEITSWNSGQRGAPMGVIGVGWYCCEARSGSTQAFSRVVHPRRCRPDGRRTSHKNTRLLNEYHYLL
jgi:hypothetical protein